ncbi:Chitinase 2 [Sporothrix eucalyptigena]
MGANMLLLTAGAGLVAGVAALKPPGMNVYFTDPATNYPATNFGPHCGAGVYMVNSTASRLLSDCTTLSQDILYCQKLGKKVLLSTGGIWGPDPEHNYAVTTPENGEYFAEFLWKAFGPSYPSWTGPRPFDTLSENHTVIDGFDFDIEVQSASQDGYIALLKRLRTYVDQYNAIVPESPIIITGAPACPLSGNVSVMKDLITNAIFDKLWVQFYGNSPCPAGSSDFNYDDWETFIADTTSKDALLYVGLPAERDVPGYMAVTEANALVDRLKDRPSFGGVMINEVFIAKANADNGVPLYEAIYDHMLEGAQSPVVTSSPSSKVATGSNVHVATKTASVTAMASIWLSGQRKLDSVRVRNGGSRNGDGVRDGAVCVWVSDGARYLERYTHQPDTQLLLFSHKCWTCLEGE